MANILDSVRLSGVTYMLAASGGTGGSGVTSGQVETMIRNYTYDKLTIDRKIDNAFDPEQYYTKADIDTKIVNKVTTILFIVMHLFILKTY